MTNAFDAPQFRNRAAARRWLEKTRWPDGPVCPHCGTKRRAYKIKKHAHYRCAQPTCQKNFTVTTGTVMEYTHIPLNTWLKAFYLVAASKKEISVSQLHRVLNLNYRSASYMCERLRAIQHPPL